MQVLIALLMSSTVYSQKTVSNNGDTTICFSVKRAKFLLKEAHRAEECDTLRNICNRKIQFKDSIILSYEHSEKNLLIVNKNHNEIVALNKHKIEALEAAIESEKKRTKRQEFYKWCAIFVGGASTGYLTYRLVTK